MTPLETELLNEIERLQNEILKLQSEIEKKQNENKFITEKYESLQNERMTLYYKDLSEKFEEEVQNIISLHKTKLNNSENKLESLEKEQNEITQTKTELNNLLKIFSTMDYNKLQNDYEKLKNNYNSLQNEFQNIKTQLETSLEDMQAKFLIAYNELHQQLLKEMDQSLDNAWSEKLKEWLPLVDLKLNENYKNQNDSDW